MNLKAWLENLDARERRIVGGGGALAAVLILYLFIWEPITTAHERTENAVAEQRELLLWMREQAAEIKALRGQAGPARTLGARSLLAVVDQTTQQAGLKGSVRRIQPDAGGSVRVWFDDAAFDELIAWLTDLHADKGVRVESVTVKRESEPGRVTARLLLRGPGGSVSSG